MFKRDPDVIIGGKEDAYLLRWHVIPRNRFFNIYLHKFMRSDDDRALHDHPWASCSIILKGGYVEVLPTPKGFRSIFTRKVRRAGCITFRRASQRHRIELLKNYDHSNTPNYYKELPVWTLFLTGPKVREWGFWCPKGWVHWRNFTDESGNKVGKGCGE